MPYARQFIKVSSMEEFFRNRSKQTRVQHDTPYPDPPVQRFHFELTPPGSIQYVYIFRPSPFFILVLACINFMNLSTARSTKRGKGVGIRKVLGTDETR